MPNKTTFVSGLIVGAAIIAFYFYKFRHSKNYSLEDAVRIILGSASIPAGCKIMYFSYAANDLKELDSDRIFVLIGGFALTWISAATIYRVFENKKDHA